MAWPKSLSSDLPPPHADEPANLRQDIADELADHLASSAAAARAGGADEATARLAALDRFGDPAAVARQLWLEAMKGPIMRQRTLMAAAALLVLGVFAANGLAWMAFQQLRESNAALVARLEATDKKGPWGQFADLNVKLVRDDPAATPVSGYEVKLWGEAVEGVRSRNRNGGDPGHARMMMIPEKSNSEGAVRYAPILPGIYKLSVTSPTGWETERTVSLLAREWTETFVCPSEPPAAKVSVEFTWPDDSDFVFELTFYSSRSDLQEGDWFIPSSHFILFRDRQGRIAAEHSYTAGGNYLLSAFRDASDPIEISPGPYRVSATVLKRVEGGHADEFVRVGDFDENAFDMSTFDARAGTTNLWRVALSPAGIKRLREYLAHSRGGEDSQEPEKHNEE